MDSLRQSSYARLAQLMSGDKNLAIFRRFDDINILYLLSLQAEILELRKRFYIVNHIDETEGCEEERSYGASFQASQTKNSEQHQLLTELGEKLMRYNEMLTHYSQMSSLPSPRERQLEHLRSWLRDPRGGNNFQTDAEMKTWIGKEEANPKLYVALQPGLEEGDIFTRSIMHFVLIPFHRGLGERLKKGHVIDKETGFVSYDDGSIIKVTSIIVTIIAAALPPLTILALNSLVTTNQRIGLTVLFTAAFAGILACFSKAKRVEILAATATFAAVEVVFIGSAISSNDQAQITGNLTLLETINGSTIAAANLTSKSG